MEIQVLDKQENIVQVHTAIGCFSGTWCSSPPKVFKNYIVELDSDEVLTLDAVELSNLGKPQIECVGQNTYFIGFVEEIKNNLMIFRLQKAIMMLEISPYFDFSKFIGYYIKIRLREVKIYDTGII